MSILHKNARNANFVSLWKTRVHTLSLYPVLFLNYFNKTCSVSFLSCLTFSVVAPTSYWKHLIINFGKVQCSHTSFNIWCPSCRFDSVHVRYHSHHKSEWYHILSTTHILQTWTKTLVMVVKPTTERLVFKEGCCIRFRKVFIISFDFMGIVC